MTNKKEEAAQLSAAALGASSSRPERRPPRVAMNAVTDFTGELTRVERDRDEARAQLAMHDGAFPTRKLAPKLIKPSKFANRIDASFEGMTYEALKQEIASAGGNIQPIKVRPVADGFYEIVFGHRRHRACLDLGLDVLATIHAGMTDKGLFEEMSRENEQRKDLSAYELAMHYKRGIELKLYKNWAEIAAILGKTKALVSRYSALAELPKAIVDAFPTPNDIQPKWAEKLRQVIEADSEAVMRVAGEVRGRGLPPKAIFEALMNQPQKEFTRVNFSFGEWKESTEKIAIELNKNNLPPEAVVALCAFMRTLEKK
jgi:ParB family chromosome partitioning protein